MDNSRMNEWTQDASAEEEYWQDMENSAGMEADWHTLWDEAGEPTVNSQVTTAGDITSAVNQNRAANALDMKTPVTGTTAGIPEAISILKEYFGYPSFRPGQEEIVSAILRGQDALAVMPTGAGKSICYQVPAMLLPGITIVISPLISLMQDQVKSLNAAGIHAAYINSSLSDAQIRRALRMAAEGSYKIIYAAPERLESRDFRQFAEEAQISMVTVDEAHCISQWGQDFRPSYLKIVDFIRTLSVRPIISAFTATATGEVKEDIRCILGLRDPKVLVTGFDRPNLYYEVDHVRKKDDFILDYVRKHPEESGIIYCATRKNVDNLFELLFKAGISAAKYHAGMGAADRKLSQEGFVYDRTAVMVATNAFGMGIDKSNVRFVIHYNMPQSMENYYQEAGRAGRDGEDSRCILLFSPQDIMIDKMLLEQKDFSAIDPMDVENIRERDQQRLRIMENYCRTTECLRNYILNYFGEKTAEPCGNCANCRREYTEEDRTAEAKQIINCVAEVRGRYGINIITGILAGANRARLKEIGASSYRTFGRLSEVHEEVLKELIQQMVRDEYLILTADRYSVLRIGPRAMDLKDDSVRVMMRVREKAAEEMIGTVPKKRRASRMDDLTSLGFRLFEQLRDLRMTIARELNLPPYIIFTDRTLIDMCLKVPRTKPEMMDVSGVAAAKFEKYGERFLDSIAEFIAEHPGQVISTWKPEEPASSVGADGRTDDGNRKDGSVNGDGSGNSVNGSGSDRKASSGKKKRSRKPEFCLSPEDVTNYSYDRARTISEITEELNRINTNTEVKKLTTITVSRYLLSLGWIEEQETTPGHKRKIATEAGLAVGIYMENRTSQAGMVYEIVQYPENVQRKVAEYMASEEYRKSIEEE